MYFYEVGYHSHEECPVYTLYHNKKFSKKDFNNLLLDVTEDAFLKIKKKWKKYYTSEKYLKEEEELKRIYPEHIDVLVYERFEDLYKTVVDILIEKYGFKHPKIVNKFIPMGWASLLRDDWKEETECDEIMNLLRERFKKYNKK